MAAGVSGFWISRYDKAQKRFGGYVSAGGPVQWLCVSVRICGCTYQRVVLSSGCSREPVMKHLGKQARWRGLGRLFLLPDHNCDICCEAIGSPPLVRRRLCSKGAWDLALLLAVAHSLCRTLCTVCIPCGLRQLLPCGLGLGPRIVEGVKRGGEWVAWAILRSGQAAA